MPNTQIATFTPGMRVLCRDAEWLVTRVASSSSSPDSNQQVVYCAGADDLTRGHEAAFLTQLDAITPVDPRKTRLVADASGGYSKAKLFLEAQLRQMPLTDPTPRFEDMGAFTPMPYQEEAVHKTVGQLRPRLLLADAVGLGKTIEVGMILTELMRRGQAGRILVLAKKSMLTQFQAELWNRFSIPLVRLDSAGLSKLQLRIPASKNPFEVYHRVILSIDTLKNIGRYAHFLEATRWDVVVIDEAHNVAGGESPERHLSFRLARRLARRTNSMILTTATPHNGKRETFGRLISLLDPSAIPDPKLREYEAKDISPFFLMRFKEDVREQAGDNFSDRVVISPSETTVSATSAEEEAYRVLSELRAESRAGKGSADAIVQWGMYKSFLSSPEACRSTAEKRLAQVSKSDPAGAEAKALTALLKSLKGIQVADSARFSLLLRELKTLGWDGKPNSPRVLIFTESRKTQDALCDALARQFKLKFSPKEEAQPNQVLAYMHGGMSDTALAKTVEGFGTGSSPIRVMVATDVASEGVNLHRQCHQLIHYDLPWSVITMIQRNGRIDRFGQKQQPVIRYLMVETREGLLQGDKELFERLVAKVEEINRSTRSGESVLKLYDADKESDYIGSNLVKGNTKILDQAREGSEESDGLEQTLQQASKLAHLDLSFLMGDEEAESDASLKGEPAEDPSALRLLANDAFLERGYAELRTAATNQNDYPPLEKTAAQIILQAPPDLARRLDAPWASSDVVFGATAIPEEAWPQDKRLHLTTSPQRVDLAIEAAMVQKGQWSQELLLNAHHPVMVWLAERLMMLMERDQAPLIISPHLDPGELVFCFIGQVSSRAGTPLIVDAHAVTYRKGGSYDVRPLRAALARARFDDLANQGKTSALPEELLKGFVSGAVSESLKYLKQRKDERRAQNKPRIEQEEARLRAWFESWGSRIEDQLKDAAPEGKTARKLRLQRDEMERYLVDRTDHWKNTHFWAVDEPVTRLVLAIEGVAR